IPGTFSPEVAEQVQDSVKDAQVFMVGNANDAVGYFGIGGRNAVQREKSDQSIFGAVSVRKVVGWCNLLLKAVDAPNTPPAAGVNVAAAPIDADPEPGAVVTAARFPAVDFHVHMNNTWYDVHEKLRLMDET